MGTQFTHNDSLQITREQGFPKELVYEEHCKKPLKINTPDEMKQAYDLIDRNPETDFFKQ